MTALVWDDAGNRFYETGIEKGVIYPIDASGDYPIGYAWNGLISVNESPSGAETSPLYADNIKYLELVSTEEFGCTIEAFTYPTEFEQCDGSIAAAGGTYLAQQARKKFALVYQTKVGNDVDGDDHGYKIHIIYGCLASPSEKTRQTVNDSPEAVTFSWDITTTPDNATGYRATSKITIDSRTASAVELAAMELVLFGDVATDPNVPHPDAIIAAMTP